MKEFNITDDLMIECRVYETRYSWGHKARILRNTDGIYFEVDKKKVTYYNRTWEAWQFASIIRQCAESKQLTSEEKESIKKYLKDNNA